MLNIAPLFLDGLDGRQSHISSSNIDVTWARRGVNVNSSENLLSVSRLSDDHYQFDNGSTAVTQYDDTLTKWNSYLGGDYQHASQV